MDIRPKVSMTIVGVAVLASLPAFLVALGGGGIGVAIGGLLLATVVGAMASLLLAANITRPLKQLTTLMAEVAAHNLNVIVPRPGGDETGRVLSAFANMLVSLRKTIGEVSQSAVEIASTSGELSASAAKIASNALAASERSSGAAAASEQVAVAAGHIADNCAIASQAASAANEFANASAYVSMESINSINAIAERVKGSSECIGRLGERSQQIGTIVSTIKDIAGQTNLLALNAAIEAARAGEMGRGFAVVADEVRKLAERTTQATQEISAMIELIQAETLSAVGSMELGMVDVEKGVEEGARSSEAICEILNQVIQLSGEISQIASAAQEQKTATDDISANIQQVSTTVEGSAHEAKTVAAAATNLSRQASLLTSLVANFRI